MQNDNQKVGHRSHPFGNIALGLSAVVISLLLFSLASYVSLVLRHTSNLASVVEHNGVIPTLRFQAVVSLVPVTLFAVALKMCVSNRLAIIGLVVSLLCGLGYLLLEQFIRSLF